MEVQSSTKAALNVMSVLWETLFLKIWCATMSSFDTDSECTILYFCASLKIFEKQNSYFVQKRDTTQSLDLLSLQKIVAAFHQLGYGYSADSIDRYVCISWNIATECLKEFCGAVVEGYGRNIWDVQTKRMPKDRWSLKRKRLPRNIRLAQPFALDVKEL